MAVQITVGAKCWDGERRKSLTNAVKVTDIVNLLNLTEHIRFDPKLKALMSFGIPLATLAPAHAFAAPDAAIPVMSPAVKSKILHAFDPLIDLVQSLSYPIAGVMIAAGCLFIMVGNRERGMQMLQNAAIGYILVQLSPMMLSLLVGIGEGI